MSEPNSNVQELARRVLESLDALLQSVEGGEGLRVLVDARGVVSGYVQRGSFQPDKPLTVKPSSVGGVTLVRGGQHFTINDDELETVRDAVNSRKREIRKRERRESRAARTGQR
jgi:hypothetical protein